MELFFSNDFRLEALAAENLLTLKKGAIKRIFASIMAVFRNSKSKHAIQNAELQADINEKLDSLLV